MAKKIDKNKKMFEILTRVLLHTLAWTNHSAMGDIMSVVVTGTEQWMSTCMDSEVACGIIFVVASSVFSFSKHFIFY